MKRWFNLLLVTTLILDGALAGGPIPAQANAFAPAFRTIPFGISAVPPHPLFEGLLPSRRMPPMAFSARRLAHRAAWIITLGAAPALALHPMAAQTAAGKSSSSLPDAQQKKQKLLQAIAALQAAVPAVEEAFKPPLEDFYAQVHLNDDLAAKKKTELKNRFALALLQSAALDPQTEADPKAEWLSGTHDAVKNFLDAWAALQAARADSSEGTDSLSSVDKQVAEIVEPIMKFRLVRGGPVTDLWTEGKFEKMSAQFLPDGQIEIHQWVVSDPVPDDWKNPVTSPYSIVIQYVVKTIDPVTRQGRPLSTKNIKAETYATLDLLQTALNSFQLEAELEKLKAPAEVPPLETHVPSATRPTPKETPSTVHSVPPGSELERLIQESADGRELLQDMAPMSLAAFAAEINAIHVPAPGTAAKPPTPEEIKLHLALARVLRRSIAHTFAPEITDLSKPLPEKWGRAVVRYSLKRAWLFMQKNAAQPKLLETITHAAANDAAITASYKTLLTDHSLTLHLTLATQAVEKTIEAALQPVANPPSLVIANTPAPLKTQQTDTAIAPKAEPFDPTANIPTAHLQTLIQEFSQEDHKKLLTAMHFDEPIQLADRLTPILENLKRKPNDDEFRMSLKLASLLAPAIRNLALSLDSQSFSSLSEMERASYIVAISHSFDLIYTAEGHLDELPAFVRKITSTPKTIPHPTLPKNGMPYEVAANTVIDTIKQAWGPAHGLPAAESRPSAPSVTVAPPHIDPAITLAINHLRAKIETNEANNNNLGLLHEMHNSRTADSLAEYLFEQVYAQTSPTDEQIDELLALATEISHTIGSLVYEDEGLHGINNLQYDARGLSAIQAAIAIQKIPTANSLNHYTKTLKALQNDSLRIEKLYKAATTPEKNVPAPSRPRIAADVIVDVVTQSFKSTVQANMHPAVFLILAMVYHWPFPGLEYLLALVIGTPILFRLLTGVPFFERRPDRTYWERLQNAKWAAVFKASA